jgi:hypothetical protein
MTMGKSPPLQFTLVTVEATVRRRTASRWKI